MKNFIFFLITIFTFTPLQAQWVQTSLDSITVNTLASNGSDLFVGAAGWYGVYHSTDNGTNWSTINNGLEEKWSYFEVSAFTIKDTILFVGVYHPSHPAGTIEGGVYRSTNNGETWSATALTPNYDVHALAVKGANIFAGCLESYSPQGIFISSDNGVSWTEPDSGLADGSGNAYEVWALAVDGENIFAGGAGVHCSTNDGKSWAPINTGLPAYAWVVTLAVSDTNLFAGSRGMELGIPDSVYLSTNNGTSWTQANTPFSYFSNIVGIGTNLFAGTDKGIYHSSNNGISWSEENVGLRTSVVSALAISGSYLFAATDSGVWRRPLSEMITDAKQLSSHLPQNYSLSQNFPNPFNPSTVISYQLQVNSKVSLKIYDLLGREVATLVNEEQSAGWKEIEWNATNVASGIYFYKLQANNFIETKKMLVIK